MWVHFNESNFAKKFIPHANIPDNRVFFVHGTNEHLGGFHTGSLVVVMYGGKRRSNDFGEIGVSNAGNLHVFGNASSKFSEARNGAKGN